MPSSAQTPCGVADSKASNAGAESSPSAASLNFSSSGSFSQVLQRVDQSDSAFPVSEESEAAAHPRCLGSRGRARRCAICSLLLVLSILLLKQIPFKGLLLAFLQRWRASFFAYILTYTVAGLVVPAPFLSVLGGVLFGASLKAAMAIYAGSFLAAVLSFAASRLLLRGQVKRLLFRRRSDLRAFEEALTEDSLALTVSARLVTPFTACNYFLGVTPVSATTFCAATLVSCFPFAFVYALIGGELGSLEAAAKAEGFAFASERVDVFGFFFVEVRLLRWVGVLLGLSVFGFAANATRKLAQRTLGKARERRQLQK